MPLNMGVVQTTIESTVYATIEEPKVVIVLICDAKVDSTRLLANPADFITIDR